MQADRVASTEFSCLADERIFAFAQGRLAAESVSELEEHLSICADCRAVLAETARYFVGSESTATLQMGPHEIADMESAAESELPCQLAPGTHVSRYVLSGVIGSGAAGVVYRGYDPELRREIALKLLRATPARDSASLKARLLREAQAMAQLSHPNVVSVYDVGTYGSQVFIVLELVKGHNLAEWLDQTPRSWQEICWAFVEAGKGLAAAHAVQLVHRDFKPANVLIGSDGRVRVTDFGLARSTELGSSRSSPVAPLAAVANTDPASTEFSITTTQAGLAGTPVYMAPEQFAQQRTDERTDQFGFCVALYLALYRRHPFLDFDGPTRRYSLAELAGQVSRGSLHVPPDSEVPKPLLEILRRGLRVDPDARFRSMEELLEMLAATPKVPSFRPPRPKRHWATVALPLLVIALLALGARVYQASSSDRPLPTVSAGVQNPGKPEQPLSSLPALPPAAPSPARAPSPAASSMASARPAAKSARAAAQRAAATPALVAPAGRKQYSDGLKEPF